MKFMILVYPGPAPEQGVMPAKEVIDAVTKFNEELIAAGVLLGMDGLQPTSKGARVTYADGKPTVTDGPFTESKEILGGYWTIKADSLKEAVDWAKKAPMPSDHTLEVRQVFDMEDFAPETIDKDAQKRICDSLASA